MTNNTHERSPTHTDATSADGERRLDPIRLCDAAEAMMCAAVDYADNVGVWPGSSDLIGSDAEDLSRFSIVELHEAANILDRLGIFEGQRDAA